MSASLTNSTMERCDQNIVTFLSISPHASCGVVVVVVLLLHHQPLQVVVAASRETEERE